MSNKNVRPELKASGQAFNSMLSMGIARIIGSLGGGWLISIVGYQKTFFIMSGMCLFALIGYTIIFKLYDKKLQLSEL